MWIELHGGARVHPKIKGLARDLGIERPHAFGHVVTLWLWTLEISPDGDLSSFTVDEIEEGAKWTGPPGAFVDAMVARRLLDRTMDGLVVHDWVDYAAHLKARERKRRERERKRKRERQRELVQTMSRDTPDPSRDHVSRDTPDLSRDVTRRPAPVTGTDRPTDRPTDPIDSIDSIDPSRDTPHPSRDIFGATDGELERSIGLDEFERVGATRLGSIDLERTALQLLENLAPFSQAEIDKATNGKAKTWLYAAKVIRTDRDRNETSAAGQNSRESALDARQSAREAEDGERFAGDPNPGLEALAEAVGAKRGMS